ncbi:MAG: hypothetical protein B7Y35_09570 [Sphingomonadales bacterium 28-64-96]|nr:MAG: hypothetical protein B7Y35_09570 [Sphingomonadales bacterium 28-64-96]
MPSFNAINYSLRPSKSIQRQIVFNCLRSFQSELGLDDLVYIGFGSIWFTDFVLAHKLLKIQTMISIEANLIGYRRALFNVPYANVVVKNGYSYDILPELLVDAALTDRPWLIWLDYDYELTESVRDDLRLIVENAPPGSLLLATVNGNEMKYGPAAARPDRLREILGAVVPDDLPKKSCKDERMQATLADLMLDYLVSVAADIARPGGFVPAFRVIYQDGAPMVTVGGILPTKETVQIARDAVAKPDWPGKPPKPISAPNLTLREAAVLQSQLPCVLPIDRAKVQALGFDLDDEQIETFSKYYCEYPMFAQIST